MEIREEIKDINRERSKELRPGQHAQAMVRSPQHSSFAHVGDNMSSIAKALDMVSEYANKQSQKQKDEELIQGEVLRRQGKAYSDADKAGKYTGQGWQVADVQIKASELYLNEKHRIKTEFYAQSPEEYSKHVETLMNNLVSAADSIDDPVLKKHVLENAIHTSGRLAEYQAETNIDYNYKKTVESIPLRINAVLDAAGDDPVERQAALEDAKEMMQPGRFNIDPEDHKRAIRAVVDSRLDNGDTTLAEAYLEMKGTPIKETAAQKVASKYPPKLDPDVMLVQYEDPNVAAIALIDGEDAANEIISNSIDPTAPDLSEEEKAKANTVLKDIMDLSATEEPTTVADEDKSILKGIQKVKAKIADGARINYAASTGNFGLLKTPKETQQALTAMQIKAMNEVEPMIQQAEGETTESYQARKEQAAFTLYAKRLQRTGEIDKDIAKAFKSYISPVTAYSSDGKTNPDSIKALEGLKTLSENTSPSYYDKYLSGEDKDFALRALSYMEDGDTAENALRKADVVQKQIDSKVNFEKIPEESLKEAVDNLISVSKYGSGIFNSVYRDIMPDFLESNPDAAQSMNTPMTDEDLKAGFNSSEGKKWKNKIEEYAKRYLPKTQHAAGAVKRAVAERAPFTQVIMGVPIMTEFKPFHELLDVNEKLLTEQKNLVHEAVVQELEARADYSTLDAAAYDLKKISEYVVNKSRALRGLDELPSTTTKDVGALGRGYKTYFGEKNSFKTFLRGVPNYQNLKVEVHEATGMLVINYWDEAGQKEVYPNDIKIPLKLIGARMKAIKRGK